MGGAGLMGKAYLGVDLIYDDTTGGGGWTRPADWLALPAASDSFVGLFAVTNDSSNYLALSAAGDYTVNWGDGNTENVASGVIAEHQYTYSAISSDTDCTRGYRQVIVQVYPQAGQSLTSVGLAKMHSRTGLQVYENAPWLDIAVSSSALTLLDLYETSQPMMGWLEQVTIGSNAFTGTALVNMFNGCWSLQSVPLFDTSGVTSMASMFLGCHALRSVPLFDTSNVTTMNGMFKQCHSLLTVPLFDTSSVVSIGVATMFEDCYALQTVPLFDLSGVTSMASMFKNCNALQSVPLFDTSAVTTMSSAFNGCWNLQSVPAFNMGAVTTTSTMFLTCRSLRSAPLSGTKVSFTVASCMLGATELNAIYTGLAAASATITVTGNHGVDADDPSIATAKGWTVTG